MATFSDDFNRANGALGGGWITDPAGSVTITANKASSANWESRALRELGVTDGYRVQVVINRREWPFLLVRYINGYSGYYAVVWSNPEIELVRRIDGVDVILQTGPSPAATDLAVWAEVREVAGGTQIKWGHGTTTAGTYTDNTVGRPAGTMAGFQSHPGKTFDDFVVESLTGGGTLAGTVNTRSTAGGGMAVVPLPETLTPGVTPGHVAHHNRIHAAAGSGLPTTVAESSTGHMAHHAELKTWYDAAHPGSPLPTVTDGASHAEAHQSLHAWRNNPTTAPGDPGTIQPGATSLLHPVYLNSGSVFQRDVRTMPLATNSAGIATNIRQQQINTGYYTGCSIWAYNFPSYAIDSTTTPMAAVTWRNLRKWDWTPQDVMDAAFGQKPIPEWAVPAAGTDAALVVYDIATDTMWEYWQMIKTGPYQWAAEWGSRTLNANNNYSNQAGVGSLSASGLNGVLGQIGIGEVRAGRIDHAIIFACTGSGIGYSWPAKQSDGSSTDPNAPKQGQWGRLDPAFNVETLDNELLRIVGRAAQRYGIVPVDFAGSVSFCGESGAHEQATTGTNPWTAILANQGGGKADWEVMHGFPWERTQWAPVDWGKP